MKFYPINLKVKNKKVLIVGGGRVGFRKFKRLLIAGARLTVVSPEFNPEFSSYIKNKSLHCEFKKRKFQEKDLISQFLVIAAVDKAELNKRIALLAKGRNILVNIIDNAELSDFTVPAAVNRGELLLTASSGSMLPALSKNIKAKLKAEFGVEYQLLLALMKKKRPEIIAEIADQTLRKEIFKELASEQFLAKIREIIAALDFDLAKAAAEKRREKQAAISENNDLFSKLDSKTAQKLYLELEAEIDKIIALKSNKKN